MNKTLFTLVAVIVVITAGVGGYYLQVTTDTGSRPAAPAEEAVTHETVIGLDRPDFELPAMDGELRAISEWDGDVLAINFWATWCQPCKDEIPEFAELQSRFRDQGVTFVGVAIDHRAAVSEFAEQYGINYPVLIGEQAAIDAAKSYGNHIGALPYTAFVDRNGTIVHVHRGRLPYEQAEAILHDMVGGPVTAWAD